MKKKYKVLLLVPFFLLLLYCFNINTKATTILANDEHFICGEGFIDTRDNQSYSTVKIGTQCWMAQNLRYLPSVVGPGTGSTTVPHYYVYGYEGANVNDAKAYMHTDNWGNTLNMYETYGVIYNWSAAMAGSTIEGAQGVCPDGWHLPTDTEQHILESYLWGQTTGTCDATSTTWNCKPAGSKLAGNKSLWGISGLSEHTQFGTSGFNALPGRGRSSSGDFFLGHRANFWSSSISSSGAWSRYLDSSNTGLLRQNVNRAIGLSVRCTRQITDTKHPPAPTNFLFPYGPDGEMRSSPTTAGIFIFKDMISHRNRDKVKLQIEIRESSQPLTGNYNYESDWVQGYWSEDTILPPPNECIKNPIYQPHIARINLLLTPGTYHWQIRAIDEHGASNSWVSSYLSQPPIYIVVEEWEIDDTHTITYNANGGSCTPTSRTINHGGSASGPSCSRAGYTLNNFSITSGNCAGTFNSTTGACAKVEEPITIRANWDVLTPVTHTVTYQANGGSCTPTSRTVNHSSSASGPSCTRAGYTLNNFSITSGNCTGTFNPTTGECTKVEKAITIRANWDPVTYTVTYNANGGKCTPSNRIINHGGSAQRPSCSRTGYTLNDFSIISGSCAGTFNSSTGECSRIEEDITIRVNFELLQKILVNEIVFDPSSFLPNDWLFMPYELASAKLTVKYEEHIDSGGYQISNINYIYKGIYWGYSKINLTRDGKIIWSKTIDLKTDYRELSFFPKNIVFYPTDKIEFSSRLESPPLLSGFNDPLKITGALTGLKIFLIQNILSSQIHYDFFHETTFDPLDKEYKEYRNKDNTGTWVGNFPYQLYQNAGVVKIGSPAELRVHNAQGQSTGLFNGKLKQEIPNSIYLPEEKAVVITDLFKTCHYEIVGTDTGTYSLTISTFKNGELITYTSEDIFITLGQIHKYRIDWDKFLESKGGGDF